MVAKLTDVKTVKAHVLDGQIVLDEPIELPDGTAVEVLVPGAALTAEQKFDAADEADEDPAMTPEELEEHERELELGYAEYERGEFIEARELIRKLASDR